MTRLQDGMRGQASSMTEPVTQALEIHRLLLDYFGYPEWPNLVPPLDELISTILSQNTNDTNRDRAFQALCRRFSSWEEVRDAEPEAVINAIRTAGLANQKGPRIQEVLREITRQRGSLSLDFLSALPPEQALSWLQSFKGVGPKTASIVLLFSLGQPAFPVDTHIYRVTGRLGLRPARMTVEQAHGHLAKLFPSDTYYALHLNLIRLGREICHARKPSCPVCPLKQVCEYYRSTNLETGASARSGVEKRGRSAAQKSML
jgi:endonuclease III